MLLTCFIHPKLPMMSHCRSWIIKGESTCPEEDIATIVRSQGLCPTEKQVADAVSGAGISGPADLKAVQAVVSALEGTRDPDLAESLKIALAVFDADQTGSIPSTELSHVCRNMGEKLTEEEVNSIMLNAPDDGMGGIEYGQFAAQVAAMASK